VYIDLDGLSPIVRIVRSQIANRVVREAISRRYLTEIDHKGVIEKVVKMARRKKKRGDRVLAEKKAYH